MPLGKHKNSLCARIVRAQNIVLLWQTRLAQLEQSNGDMCSGAQRASDDMRTDDELCETKKTIAGLSKLQVGIK